jgi:hypothetical protein
VVNGHRLKFYNKPMSQDEFISTLLQQVEMEVVSERGNSPTLVPS